MSMPVNFLGELKTRLRGRKEHHGDDEEPQVLASEMSNSINPDAISADKLVKGSGDNTSSSHVAAGGCSEQNPTTSPTISDQDVKKMLLPVNLMGDLKTRLKSRRESSGDPVLLFAGELSPRSPISCNITTPWDHSGKGRNGSSSSDDCPEQSIVNSPFYKRNFPELCEAGENILPVPSSFFGDLKSRLRNRRASENESPISPGSSSDDLTTSPSIYCNTSPSTEKLVGDLNDHSSTSDSDVFPEQGASCNSSRNSEFGWPPDVSTPVPLNHNAALHKMAVRPKRLSTRRGKGAMNQSTSSSEVTVGEFISEVGEDTSETFEGETILEVPESEDVLKVAEGQDCSEIPELNDLSLTLRDMQEDIIYEEIPDSMIDFFDNENALNTSNLETIEEDVVLEIHPELVPELDPVQECACFSDDLVSESSVACAEDFNPPVRSPRSKSNAAKMKFEHEIEQYYKRQQKLSDSDSEGIPVESNTNTLKDDPVTEKDISALDLSLSEVLDDLDDFVVVEIFDGCLVMKQDILLNEPTFQESEQDLMKFVEEIDDCKEVYL